MPTTTLPPLPPFPIPERHNGKPWHIDARPLILAARQYAEAHAAACVAAERASLLAVLRVVGEAMQVSMIYVGGEGSDEELSAHQDALAALNEALKEQL